MSGPRVTRGRTAFLPAFRNPKKAIHDLTREREQRLIRILVPKLKYLVAVHILGHAPCRMLPHKNRRVDTSTLHVRSQSGLLPLSGVIESGFVDLVVPVYILDRSTQYALNTKFKSASAQHSAPQLLLLLLLRRPRQTFRGRRRLTQPFCHGAGALRPNERLARWTLPRSRRNSGVFPRHGRGSTTPPTSRLAK